MLSGNDSLFSSGDGVGDYLDALWSGVLALACLGIVFNVRDVAFRIYQFAMDRAPIGPGPGFSPTLLRVLGAFLGVAVGVEFVTDVMDIMQ